MKPHGKYIMWMDLNDIYSAEWAFNNHLSINSASQTQVTYSALKIQMVAMPPSIDPGS